MAVTFDQVFGASTPDTTPSDTLRWRGNITGFESNPLDIPGLPRIGDPHPLFPGLSLDVLRLSQRINPQGDCFFEGLYSSDGRFRPQPRRDDNSTTDSWWTVTRERGEKLVPLFQATPRYTPKTTINDDGDQVVTGVQTTWELVRADRKLLWNRKIYSRQVTIETSDFSVADDLITAQINQVHLLPDGRDYLFIAGDTTQVSLTKWQVNYQWIWEPPCPIPQIPDAPSGTPTALAPYYFVTAPPFPGDSVYSAYTNACAPPFYGFQVVPGSLTLTVTVGGSTTEVSVPSVVAVDDYAGNRNNSVNPGGLGWQSLPGNPIPIPAP